MLAIAMIIAGVVLIIRNGDLTSGLWLMLIAMFILPSSTAEARRASRNRREERVVGIPVRSVMTSVPTASKRVDAIGRCGQECPFAASGYRHTSG